MNRRMDEQTALVTGAGSAEGIGFAVARRLQSAGACVAITSTTDRIHARARELDPAGNRALSFVADLMAATFFKKKSHPDFQGDSNISKFFACSTFSGLIQIT